MNEIQVRVGEKTVSKARSAINLGVHFDTLLTTARHGNAISEVCY